VPQQVATVILLGVLLLLASLLVGFAGAVVGGCLGFVTATVEGVHSTHAAVHHATSGMVAGFKVGTVMGLVGTLVLSILGCSELPTAPAAKSQSEAGPPR
jgi:hypothetical protein